MAGQSTSSYRQARNSTLAALAAMLVLGFAATSGRAQPKPLKKVQIIVATPVLNVSYSQVMLPLTLGYWRSEGYDVDVHSADGSLQAMQQLVGGNAEFAAGSGAAVIQTNVKSNLPVRVALSYSASDWSLAVDEAGPIKTAKDLKGKTLGIINLASGGLPFLNGLLRSNGFEPGRDVDIVAVGLGPGAVQALQSSRVQGLMFWGSATASFENAGLKLRKIVGDDWHTYPEYSLAVMDALAQKDPDMVIAIARGSIKAMVFSVANPLCAVKLHWAKFPSTKPTGADEATLLKWDLHSFETQLKSMSDAHDQFGGGKLWGKYDPAAWDRLIKFMVDAKQLDKTIPAGNLALNIPNFYEKVNDFDHKAVEDSAKQCKF